MLGPVDLKRARALAEMRGGFKFRETCDRAIQVGGGIRRPARLGDDMGNLERLVPSEIIEQWVAHLRRQRARAADAIWLMEQGYTFHEGRDGTPQHDATNRTCAEQQAVIEDVNALLALYDGINLGRVDG